MGSRTSSEKLLSDPVQTIPAAVAYGRVSRRLRAYLIDWIIMVLLLVAVLFIAVWAESDRIGRILGFALIGTLRAAAGFAHWKQCWPLSQQPARRR
jgi:uncharacterized RDD family membrane protein YckC